MLPVPMKLQASPMTPDCEQYFAFAPLPVVLHSMFAGHVLVRKSQFTWQPHDVLQVTSLHAEAMP